MHGCRGVSTAAAFFLISSPIDCSDPDEGIQSMKHCFFLVFCLILCHGVAISEDSSRLPSEKMPLAPQSMLLDIASHSKRSIAVGERGHVVLSEDGINWRQAEFVPTRSTLTAVAVIGDEVWAVGHDAVIIHSADGGENWELQQAEPELYQPLLDVFFLDENNGFAIGAYAYFLGTRDGGETWAEVSLLGDEPVEDDAEAEHGDEEDATYDFSDYEDDFVDYHLNAMIRMPDGRLVIAAEAGAGFVSDDQGESWLGVDMPYAGSMFSELVTPDGKLVAFGLRGHVLESSDGGTTWEELETGSLNTLLGGTVTAAGTLVIVGSNGQVLTRAAGETGFGSSTFSDGGDLAGVVAIDNHTVIVVGENGALRYSLTTGS
jgi:photosystem II stability/assembly factor-like uncharacterized protein